MGRGCSAVQVERLCESAATCNLLPANICSIEDQVLAPARLVRGHDANPLNPAMSARTGLALASEQSCQRSDRRSRQHRVRRGEQRHRLLAPKSRADPTLRSPFRSGSARRRAREGDGVMAYKTHSGAVRQAQRLANADGAPRVVVDDGSSGGGCVKFHIVADLVGLARFYEQRAEGQPRAVTVVQPQAREGAHKTTPTRATPTNRTWQRVYRVIPEVTEVIEWETDGKEGIVAMRKATVLFVVLIALVPTVGCIEYAAAAFKRRLHHRGSQPRVSG